MHVKPLGNAMKILQVTNIRLAGVEHCLQFSAVEDDNGAFRVYMRSYKIRMLKSSDPKLPRAELDEIGPAVDMVLRRSHLASEDLTKTASKQVRYWMHDSHGKPALMPLPFQVKNLHKKKKVKNIEEDAFGSTLGTVHVPAQDVSR